MIKILFSFLAFYPVIKNYLDMVFGKIFGNLRCFFQGFSTHELFENGIPDHAFYR